MAKASKPMLVLLAAVLAALLLAGCSGGGSVDADDNDGDGDADQIDGGGSIQDDNPDKDGNDAPGAALGVMLAVLGVAAFVRRRKA